MTYTYKKWITVTTRHFNILEEEIDLILINQGLNADDEYNVAVAKTALVKEFAALIPLADIGEGGYSTSWKWEAIKFWYKATCADLGLDSTLINEREPNVITGKSDIW
ncbi:MAG: hypothetical protein LBS01_02350 [Prevotellaceae bacterium]|jgi:hypothetical protein|nr:hypothetical protein [Prevotellaceae bacterium]